jgi:hypothetical protein
MAEAGEPGTRRISRRIFGKILAECLGLTGELFGQRLNSALYGREITLLQRLSHRGPDRIEIHIGGTGQHRRFVQ